MQRPAEILRRFAPQDDTRESLKFADDTRGSLKFAGMTRGSLKFVGMTRGSLKFVGMTASRVRPFRLTSEYMKVSCFAMDIAILGGGHGCYAAAADLSEAGHRVRLWRRDAAALQPVVESGSIVLKDADGARPRANRAARRPTSARHCVVHS